MLSDQLTTILLILVLVVTMVTVLFYAAIFTNYSPEDPLRLGVTGGDVPDDVAGAVPATLTQEAEEVYPPTWTPSPTNTPGPTATPTETRTPTPTSTPTLTPTPIPTRPPTATSTPEPTFTPTRAPSPTPLPWVVDNVETENNCEVVRVLITALNRNGVGQGQVDFEVGELNIPNSRFIITTDANGRAAWDNTPGKAHTWFVAPIENDQRAGPLVTWQSDDEGVCEISSAIQIYDITWRRLY
jgi:hypothetical protein